MIASKIIKTAANVVAPAARRAMTQGAIGGAAKTTGKVNPILWAVPPALVVFGYGGVVCAGETGALNRIHQTFGAMPGSTMD